MKMFRSDHMSNVSLMPTFSVGLFSLDKVENFGAEGKVRGLSEGLTSTGR
jgi:hypothetical protein